MYVNVLYVVYISTSGAVSLAALRSFEYLNNVLCKMSMKIIIYIYIYVMVHIVCFMYAKLIVEYFR